MDWKLLFLNSILLGFGLALDAFSVSVADAMAYPDMKRGKKLSIALTFAVFQTLMPLLGWFCVRTIADKFSLFQKAIPYIALILLCYIGIEMIAEARKDNKEEERSITSLTFVTLIVQGIATSIDAFTVGITFAFFSVNILLAVTLIGIICRICHCRLRIDGSPCLHSTNRCHHLHYLHLRLGTGQESGQGLF